MKNLWDEIIEMDSELDEDYDGYIISKTTWKIMHKFKMKLLHYVNTLSTSKNFEKALQILNRLEKIFRNDGIIYRKKGNLFYAMSDYENAYESYRLATSYLNRTDSNYTKAKLNEAKCAELLNKPIALPNNQHDTYHKNQTDHVYINTHIHKDGFTESSDKEIKSINVVSNNKGGLTRMKDILIKKNIWKIMLGISIFAGWSIKFSQTLTPSSFRSDAIIGFLVSVSIIVFFVFMMASPIAFLLQLVISEYMKARMKKINMKTVFSIFTLSLMIAIVVAKFLHLPGYPFHQYALDAASDIFSKNIQSKFEMKEDYVIGINHDEDSYIHIEEDNRCGDIKILVSRENYPKLHEFKAYRKYKIYYYPHTRICVKYEESDFNRACDLIENENYYKAIVLLDQEIKNNPKRPYAYIAKAYALVNLEKYTEAIKNCNKAIKINSEISEAYLYKCFSLIELKKYEEAQQCVGKILELDPFHEYGEYVICEISAEHIENINNRIEEGINSSLHKISDNLSIQSSNSANEESEKDQILSINEEQVRKNIEKIDKVIETKRYEGNNYFIKGNLLYSIEDYENAYDAYNFATIHLDKSDFYYAQAHYNKSLCAALLNRPAYATGALKIAIEADKKYKELAEKEKIFDNVRDSTCFKWLWDQLE